MWYICWGCMLANLKANFICIYARHCNFQHWTSWMFQIFSTFVEQYICLLVFLGKCVCTIKCTPKKAAYLYAKVGATLLMRFKYAAHKNRNFFFLRTEHGRQYFSLPRYGNGPKHHKTKHKKEFAEEIFNYLQTNKSKFIPILW